MTAKPQLSKATSLRLLTEYQAMFPYDRKLRDWLRPLYR